MLRVIDLGTTSAARSQALWHGIAAAMAPGDPPVLSLCRPKSPYVCLGFHNDLAEIDREACRRHDVAVLRRQIGGGPVWIDSDQLFFQITVPYDAAPARIEALYARLLGPAVDAFRSLGLAAQLRGVNDIAIGDRKISGTGAGRIGDGVTVVGNLLYRFPHERMAEILALPSERARAECLRLMRTRVTSTDGEGATLDDEDVKRALVAAYARALERPPTSSAPTAAEQHAIAQWEARVADPAWVAGPEVPRASVRTVKICAGVFVIAAPGVEASLVDGQLDRVEIAEDADRARVLEVLSSARRIA